MDPHNPDSGSLSEPGTPAAGTPSIKGPTSPRPSPPLRGGEGEDPGSSVVTSLCSTAASGGPPAAIADCWNQIGVNGDSTCERLAEFFHCRNCPVYSVAAELVLDRELPAGYRRQWTEHFSSEKKAAAAGKQSILIFRIGTDWLALPARVFQQIAEQRKVHSLPHRRDDVVLGLANVRGTLLICVSIGRLLGIEREYIPGKRRTVYERLVVTEWQGKPLAFPVDEVHGIHRHRPEELRETPSTVAKAGVHFTRGILPWDGKLVGCLDEELVFSTLNRSLS
jgi:chemotaxis-related protein WspD